MNTCRIGVLIRHAGAGQSLKLLNRKVESKLYAARRLSRAMRVVFLDRLSGASRYRPVGALLATRRLAAAAYLRQSPTCPITAIFPSRTPTICIGVCGWL